MRSASWLRNHYMKRRAPPDRRRQRLQAWVVGRKTQADLLLNVKSGNAFIASLDLDTVPGGKILRGPVLVHLRLHIL
ncbi:hypothetical protein OK016_06505 [Vibrio chagasii]|nr:hypothetical protein [Vibrio chagasii]